MTKELVQLTKVGKTEKQQRQSPNSHKYSEVRTREHLLPQEVEAMRSAIKQSKGRPTNSYSCAYAAAWNRLLFGE